MENPYTPPSTPVAAGETGPQMQALRRLLRMLIVIQFAIIPLMMISPESLSPEMVALRDRNEQMLAERGSFMLLLPIVVLALVFLAALWWERHWAAWGFLLTVAVSYLLQAGHAPMIQGPLQSLLDSLSDVAIGATLAVVHSMGLWVRRRPP